jgi:A/G-specific adenine glycosylase
MSRVGVKNFSAKVLQWYSVNKRSLPWRGSTDPYKIWLSEIILQQTRVSQGLPYYLHFVETYPTVHDLAAAAEQDVLRLWQGLGYYSRARNLHRCAKQVVENFGGDFPASFAGLLTLPGIGEYTAAAIASICFKEPVAVVDGNVYRVLARVFGVDTPINTPAAKKEFFALANELIPTEQPDEFNQAVMEFGALHCTPARPQCGECPLAKQCVANQNDWQKLLPVKEKKLKVRKRYFYYVVEMKGKSMAMKKREGKDIWQGLYDFPLIERTRPIATKKLAAETGLAQFDVTKPYRHVLSHQIITARFLISRANASQPATTFYSPRKIADLPKPVLISKFLHDQGLVDE